MSTTESSASPDLSAEEIEQLSPEERMIAGAQVDGVHIIHRRDRFPIRGTKAEKRAERAVALFFLLAALAGIGFIVAFIALPYHWQLPGRARTSGSTRPSSAPASG